MLKYPDEWAFVSLYDGLGGPPIFCGLLVDQRRVEETIDGVTRNQMDRCATGCNTQR
jgi:hypothetical protein